MEVFRWEGWWWATEGVSAAVGGMRAEGATEGDGVLQRLVAVRRGGSAAVGGDAVGSGIEGGVWDGAGGCGQQGAGRVWCGLEGYMLKN